MRGTTQRELSKKQKDEVCGYWALRGPVFGKSQRSAKPPCFDICSHKCHKRDKNRIGRVVLFIIYEAARRKGEADEGQDQYRVFLT